MNKNDFIEMVNEISWHDAMQIGMIMEQENWSVEQFIESIRDSQWDTNKMIIEKYDK